MNRTIFILCLGIFFIVADTYVYQAVKTATQSLPPIWKKSIAIFYWGITAATLCVFFIFLFTDVEKYTSVLRNFLITALFMNLIFKVLAMLFLSVEDLTRAFRWIFHQLKGRVSGQSLPGEVISRSEFLSKTALTVAAIPAVAMTYGILSGAHDYRIRRHKLVLKNLPKSFVGMQLAQLSDIHSGSFFNKKAVAGGIQMLIDSKPDLVFFTGDLVNNKAEEVKEYAALFSKIKAPLGVYSVLGNHDYGDYVAWPSAEAKNKNLQELKTAHKEMGWDLLLNQHRQIRIGNDYIDVLGVENYGAKGRFPKYGKLAEAYANTNGPVKLLLSHDPSHWDAQVRQYADIDVMFSGHTHGFQFGVENQYIKWSPVQYMYEQWAGLYQKNSQYLYVNRGFGYLGYPGRLGILPEITIFELANA